MMKPRGFLAALLLVVSQYSFGQQTITPQLNRSDALNIFLDCSQCDMEYFKNNFTSVNYVNDSHDADVHILVSALPTGGGGKEYTIRFLGQDSYKFMNDTLVTDFPEYYTADETRQMLLAKIQLGLVPYLLKTPYGDKLTLFIDEDTANIKPATDPWRNWAFDLSGAGSYDKQKYYKSYSLSGSLYISKITDKIKIESSNYFGFNESKYIPFGAETTVPYTISQQDLSSENLYVKGFGQHWGVGGFASFGKSEYSNLDFQMSAGPAVEYNIFSYEEAATRQFRILYSLNYEHSRYNHLTVYDRMYDDLFKHDLSINFSYYEPWGTISATSSASAYINDMSQYSIGLSAIASVRVFRGMSVNLSGGISYSQNQRTLTMEKASWDKYVTGQWEMEQGLSYSINFGISYRFGSRNNNSVNPRFGY